MVDIPGLTARGTGIDALYGHGPNAISSKSTYHTPFFCTGLGTGRVDLIETRYPGRSRGRFLPFTLTSEIIFSCPATADLIPTSLLQDDQEWVHAITSCAAVIPGIFSNLHQASSPVDVKNGSKITGAAKLEPWEKLAKPNPGRFRPG